MNMLNTKNPRSLQRGTPFSYALMCAFILFTSLTAKTAFAVPPSVIISSPTSSITNNNTPQLIYSVSTGTVVVKVDGIIVSKVSGDNLAPLVSDGTHTVRVEATNESAETNFAEVAFTLDTAPPTNTVYTKIAAGYNFVVALKSDGTLWAWGENAYGQLGDGTTASRTLPVQVGSNNTWISVTAGNYHVLAINKNGELWAWGYNAAGQLGIGSTAAKYTPVKVASDIPWVAVSAGASHTIALKNDGTLWTWGENALGQLGDGNAPADSNVPEQIGNESNWAQVAAGGNHAMALKSTGALFTWGYNAKGQLGDGTTGNSSSLLSIATGTVWTSISAGWNYSLATTTTGTSADLYAWGQNNEGQLGDNTLTNRTTPVKVMTNVNLTSLACGYYHTLAVKADGTLWAWGYNYEGEVGDGSLARIMIPTQIGTAENWASVSGGFYHSAALRSNGTLWTWGLDIYGAPNRTSPVRIGSDVSWVSVSGGELHSVGLKADGTLWAWGHDFSGELGNGVANALNSAEPVQIGTEDTWTAIAAGEGHTLALKQDGTLWAWGFNNNGQLGDNTVALKRAPVQVRIAGGTDNDWVKIAAGADFSLGLKSDGSLWAWGDNLYGQLGDGTTADQHVPEQVGLGITWVKIAAGTAHTLALDSNGNLWTWGYNSQGQIGNGTNDTQPLPVHIGDATWTSIAGGVNFSLAVKSDNSLWGWGLNTNGQLGIGTLVSKTTPSQVGSANDWAMVTAGRFQGAALKQNGTLWAWGYNTYGEVGDGTTTRRTSPVQIGSDANWSLVDAGLYHTLALKQDKTLWAWGFNGYGQLGDGSVVNKITPTEIITPVNILINNGAVYTNDLAVTLSLSATDASGVTEMQLSNDDGSTWSTAEPYAGMKEWLLDPAEGAKTVSVRFKDAAGNWSGPFIDTINLDTSLKISNVAATSNMINTNTFETSTIFFTVNQQATVTLRIIPEKLGPSGTPIYETSQNFSAGTYLFIWDGKDISGKIVPDEAYLYILLATQGTQTDSYNPTAPAGTGTVTCSQEATYNPYQNDPLTLTYTPSQASRISIRIPNNGLPFLAMQGIARAAGTYSFDWDGRTPSGQIVMGTMTADCLVDSLLRENHIVTIGDTPNVSQVQTDPYLVDLAYGQITRIKYQLSIASRVTITVLSPSGTVAATVVSNELQAAGQHEVVWNGIDTNDVSGKTITASVQGVYTFNIQAINSITGSAATAHGTLTVIN